MSYLVLDIETVTDTALWTPPAPEPAEPPTCTCVSEPGAPQPEKHKRGCPAGRKQKPAKAPEDVFAPLFAHRVVAVGAVLLDDDLKLTNAGVFGTSQFGDDERALLAAWNAYAQQCQPVLVTFAGRTFDVPVLTLRNFHHGVAQGWFTREHQHRYSGAHVDMHEQLTDYGTAGRTGFTLDNMCRLVGLPAKGEANGSSVAAMWGRGERALIERYALCDTVKQAFVFMRYRLLRGLVSPEAYQSAASVLLQWCVSINLEGVLFGCDTKKLLLQE